MSPVQLIQEVYDEDDNYVLLDFQPVHNKRKMLSAAELFACAEEAYDLADIYTSENLEEFSSNDELKAWEESFMQGYLAEEEI